MSNSNGKKWIAKHWFRVLVYIIGLLFTVGGYFFSKVKAEQRTQDTIESLAKNQSDLDEELSKIKECTVKIDKRSGENKLRIDSMKEDITEIKVEQGKQSDILWKIWDKVK